MCKFYVSAHLPPSRPRAIYLQDRSFGHPKKASMNFLFTNEEDRRNEQALINHLKMRSLRISDNLAERACRSMRTVCVALFGKAVPAGTRLDKGISSSESLLLMPAVFKLLCGGFDMSLPSSVHRFWLGKYQGQLPSLKASQIL